MSIEANIFNHHLLKIRRDRTANLDILEKYNFLTTYVGEDLIERLKSLYSNHVTLLEFNLPLKLINDINDAYQNIEITHADFSLKQLEIKPYNKVVLKSEMLPFTSESFDIIIDNLNLHFANDLPGLLIQFNHMLNNNGIFIASMFGGETLKELKQALYLAEIDLKGGVGAHFIPFCTLEVITNLTQRAKLHSPIIDSYVITVTYNHITDLMHDIRYMAQANMLFTSSNLTRDIVKRANEIYLEKFTDSENRLIASFEIITITTKKNYDSK